MSEKEATKKRSGWWKALRVALIVALGVIVLLVASIGVAVWVLTPDRLTPLVGKYASRYLDADVSADKVELTYWSTFPTVQLEVEGLKVISHALDSLPEAERAKLPAFADTLATVRRFSGGLNVWGLSIGRLMLSDVEIEHPAVNFVRADSLHANFDIVPESEDTTSTPLPIISINRFAITNGAPIRFYSVDDSIDVTVNLLSTTLQGSDAPTYSIDVEGDKSYLTMPRWTMPLKNFGLNGNVRWNQQNPRHVELEDFKVNAAGLAVKIDADVEIEENILLHKLVIDGAELQFHELVSIIPEAFGPGLKEIDTDLTADVRFELLKPYRVEDSIAQLPDMKLRLKIPEGTLIYDRLRLRSVVADIEATIHGSDLDQSVLEVRELRLAGNSMAFGLSGTVTGPLKNPMVNGRFSGRLNMSAFPAKLTAKLPFTLRGVLDGNAAVRMNLADLTPERFHYVNASGNLSLRDFRFATKSDSVNVRAFVNNAKLEFGTADTFKKDSIKIDSLLRVKLTTDTINFAGEGVYLSGGNLSLNAAARNTRSILDTTQITPIGFNIKAGRLALRADTDSMAIMLRDASVTATFQRYKQNKRTPLLSMSVGAQRLRYSDVVTRLSLTETDASLTLHPRMRRRVVVADSLRRRVVRRDSAMVDDGRENVDFDLDRSLMSWLRHWQASGNVKAKRGRLLTPYFPVRNDITNFDVDFSTDSITINNIGYRMGRSGFLINGKISNIARALTSRRGSPLRMDFNVKCDTININEITSAIMAGSAFAQRTADGSRVNLISNSEDDDSVQASIAADGADTARAAFLVPSNIDARLNVTANQVLYDDIWFQRLTGQIAISDGAVHLDRLAGYTPMGSMDLTALYSAPTVDDLHFAAGIVVRKLHLKKFLHLIPELDSIMPLLEEVDGIVTADAAMTTQLDSLMNLKFNTLTLVLKLSGDSLTLIDGNTFRTMAKWLMFKDKKHNLIKSMQAEMMVKDSRLDLFPFVFDIDRYRLGVSGSSSLDMDLDYHVAVLKSPLPFKFGINIKGHPGDIKIRLGKARFNENAVASSRQLTDTARINLISEIERVFKLGVKSGRRHTDIVMKRPVYSASEFSVGDTLTHADSLIFIQGGAIEGLPVSPFPIGDNPEPQKKKKK